MTPQPAALAALAAIVAAHPGATNEQVSTLLTAAGHPRSIAWVKLHRRQPRTVDVEATRAIIRRLAAGLGLVEPGGQLRHGALAAVARYATEQGARCSRSGLHRDWHEGRLDVLGWELARVPVPVRP